jgi:hypothetical protein
MSELCMSNVATIGNQSVLTICLLAETMIKAELQKELLFMTAMGNVPYATRDEVPVCPPPCHSLPLMHCADFALKNQPMA